MLVKFISLLRSGAGGAPKTLAHAQKRDDSEQVLGTDRGLTVATLSDGRSLLGAFNVTECGVYATELW